MNREPAARNRFILQEILDAGYDVLQVFTVSHKVECALDLPLRLPVVDDYSHNRLRPGNLDWLPGLFDS